MKAKQTKDAQIILADALARLADEAHAADGEIGETVHIVMHGAMDVEKQRVHGEIAPSRVGGEIATETDDRATSVGLDILAQCRDLEGSPVDDDRHRAMLVTGGNDLRAGGARAARHFVGRGGRREIDIGDRFIEPGVPHGAADNARFLAVAVEHRQRPGEFWFAQQRGDGGVAHGP